MFFITDLSLIDHRSIDAGFDFEEVQLRETSSPTSYLDLLPWILGPSLGSTINDISIFISDSL